MNTLYNKLNPEFTGNLKGRVHEFLTCYVLITLYVLKISSKQTFFHDNFFFGSKTLA